MFIGHYTLGQLLPLRLWTAGTSGEGVEPDEAPRAFVLDSSGDRIASYELPARDQNECTGWFFGRINLDANFSTGRYTVLYTYKISDTYYSAYDEFEILAGGDGVGASVGLYFYRQPQADFLLVQTDTGTLLTRRNPRVT